MRTLTGTTTASLSLLAGMIVLGVCGCTPKDATTVSPETPPVTAASTAAPAPPASDASAAGEDPKAMLSEFVAPGADHAALSKKLRPTKADLEAIFGPEAAAKAEAVYAPAWDGGQLVVAPKEGQTEVLVSSATSEELKSGTGAAKDFPGGWHDVAGKLKPGLHIYRFKFVEPGKDTGMAFDGLVNVNGHWCIVPKPWRALE